MKSVLKTEHINKFFHHPVSFQVLTDITMNIPSGEFTSIMGKSGSGKSTLLYILSTMDTDYEGKLYLGGDLVTGKSQNELARIRSKHIGFVFQFHYLMAEFTVLQNIMLPARKLAENSDQEIEYRAIDILKMLHIEKLALKKASQISGGEKQRVAIARALINEPDILMGDEPTGNLDSYNSENVLQIFQQLKEERGMSLLVVTHDEDLAARTDRIIRMEDGKIIS